MVLRAPKDSSEAEDSGVTSSQRNGASKRSVPSSHLFTSLSHGLVSLLKLVSLEITSIIPFSFLWLGTFPHSSLQEMKKTGAAWVAQFVVKHPTLDLSSGLGNQGPEFKPCVVLPAACGAYLKKGRRRRKMEKKKVLYYEHSKNNHVEFQVASPESHEQNHSPVCGFPLSSQDLKDQI